MNLHHIHTIANYEVKLLKRSWLIRVFVILALLILTVMQIRFFTNIFWKYGETWSKIGISSLIPFMTNYYYNIAQSVIVVFLSGNFIKRDKKLDTSEVLYVRPMSNADYIIGKVWGIIRVFMGLNLVVMLIAIFINLVLAQSPFQILPYVFYLCCVSLPSLLFVLSLSFLLMSLFKNQAVTFIVMLGTIAIVLFYLHTEKFGVFDFMGTGAPIVFSDITGLSEPKRLFGQRLIYFLFSGSFLAATTLLMNRLPLRPWKTHILGVVAVFLFASAVFSACLYVNSFEKRITKRNVYREVYQKYAENPQVNVLTHAMVVEQKSDKLFASSELTVKNNHSEHIENMVLYLNPFLTIATITSGERILPFTREEHVIHLSQSLKPGDCMDLKIDYSGSLDEDICYLDIADKDYFAKEETSDFDYGKRYLYLGRDYTLLTPECIWYPVAVPPVNPSAPYHIGKDFTYYNIKYIEKGDNIVLSQGKSKIIKDTIEYINEIPLTGVSLTKGNYEKKSITVDSTTYEIYCYKGHDFFSKHFNLIQDTLPAVIKDIREEIEINKNRNYLFSKFLMVETPIHFTGYIRDWKGYTEHIMPEIAFISERGIRTWADFNVNYMRIRDWRRGGMELGANEIQAQMMKDYIRATFMDELAPGVNMSGKTGVNPYNIGGMFFNFTGSLNSTIYPVADIAFILMQNITDNAITPRWFGNNAISDTWKANMYLSEHSFKDALEDQGIEHQLLYEILKMKSFYLRNYIIAQIPEDQFKNFLREVNETHLFSAYPFSTFLEAFSGRFGFDLSKTIDQWYHVNKAPLLHIKNVEANTVVKDDFTKYRIAFNAYNSSDIDAVLTVKTGGRMRGFRYGGGRSEEAPQSNHFVLPAKSAREIKIVYDDQPNEVVINTNVSNNVPNEMMYNFYRITDEVSDTAVGCFPIDTLLFASDPNETIIDNEDAGFTVSSGNDRQKLKHLFKKEGEPYKTFSSWRTPSVWTTILDSKCYGESRSSAVYKIRGEGKNTAQWRVAIEQEDYYELFVWNPQIEAQIYGNRYRGRRGANSHTQTYTIKPNNEEEEKVSVDFTQGEPGWVSLGNYYLTEGEISVTLGDDVTGSYVIADAIKLLRLSKTR